MWPQLDLKIANIGSFDTQSERPSLLLHIEPQEVFNADANDLRPPDNIQRYSLESIDLELCVQRREHRGTSNSARLLERSRIILPVVLDHVLGYKTALPKSWAQLSSGHDLRYIAPAVFLPQFSPHALPRQRLLTPIANSLLKFRRQRQYRGRMRDSNGDLLDLDSGRIGQGCSVETEIKNRLWVSMVTGLRSSCTKSGPRGKSVPTGPITEKLAMDTNGDDDTSLMILDFCDLLETGGPLDRRLSDAGSDGMLLNERFSNIDLFDQFRVEDIPDLAAHTRTDDDWMIDREIEESIQDSLLSATIEQIAPIPQISEALDTVSPGVLTSKDATRNDRSMFWPQPNLFSDSEDLEEDILLQAGYQHTEVSSLHNHGNIRPAFEDLMILDDSADLLLSPDAQIAMSMYNHIADSELDLLC